MPAVPTHGAGAGDTRLFREASEARRWFAERAESHVVQPRIEGRHGKACLLNCNSQRLAMEDCMFRYVGGVVGGLEQRRRAFQPIAGGVAGAIPGLWGYVGTDLIDTGPGLLVLEVNPRLTTSYVGLSAAIWRNPAGLLRWWG